MEPNDEQADTFHHTVYQLLFVANRARRNIQTAVSFLTTRVQAPDKVGKVEMGLKVPERNTVFKFDTERQST